MGTRGPPAGPSSGYIPWWRCLSTWWAPPPSKRAYGAIHRRRVRFPSTSAKIAGLVDRPPGSNGEKFLNLQHPVADTRSTAAIHTKCGKGPNYWPLPPRSLVAKVNLRSLTSLTLVAQLDRVSGFEPDGWGFESLRACQQQASNTSQAPGTNWSGGLSHPALHPDPAAKPQAAMVAVVRLGGRGTRAQ